MKKEDRDFYIVIGSMLIIIGLGLTIMIEPKAWAYTLVAASGGLNIGKAVFSPKTSNDA